MDETGGADEGVAKDVTHAVHCRGWHCARSALMHLTFATLKSLILLV